MEVAAIGPVSRRSTDMLAIDDKLVAEAVRIVRGRPAADITVETLALQVGLSRSTLEQRFRRAIGCSVHDEIVRSRLAEVRRIIGNPQLPMKQVAQACGFGHLAEFLAQAITLLGRACRDHTLDTELQILQFVDRETAQLIVFHRSLLSRW